MTIANQRNLKTRITLMISMLLLNIQMICKMFIKILKGAIQETIIVLTVFDYMITDMISNKKLNLIVTELFIRDRKLSISLVYISVLYYC